MLVAAIGMAVAVSLANAQTPPSSGGGGSGHSPTNVVQVPATNTILTVETVASNLWMFQSKPAFMSWAVRRVADSGNLDLEFKSPVIVGGGYGWGRGYQSLSPSIDEMNNLVSSNEVSFPVARSGPVTVTVRYLDSNWRTLFEGSSEKYAEQGSSYSPTTGEPQGWSLYGSDPEVTIARNIRVVILGARYLQIFPENGGEPTWLYADKEGGFNIPRNVIGSGSVIIAIDYNWNNQIVFNLRTGQVGQVGEVTGRIRPTIEGTQVLTNATQIVIRPEAQYGRGSDILMEVTYTTNVNHVRLVVRTSEGETAQKVIILNVATGETGEYMIDYGSDLQLDWQVGRYHIIPIWWNFKDSTFQPPYQYDSSGGTVAIEEK